MWQKNENMTGECVFIKNRFDDNNNTWVSTGSISIGKRFFGSRKKALSIFNLPANLVLTVLISLFIFCCKVFNNTVFDESERPKKGLKFKRIPIPLVTKGRKLLLHVKLHDLHVSMPSDETGNERRDHVLKVREHNLKIEKNSKFVNISMIIEATIESSFQLWFQTLYMFPIFVGLNKNTFSSSNLLTIVSIVASFLTTAYTMVIIR